MARRRKTTRKTIESRFVGEVGGLRVRLETDGTFAAVDREENALARALARADTLAGLEAAVKKLRAQSEEETFGGARAVILYETEGSGYGRNRREGETFVLEAEVVGLSEGGRLVVRTRTPDGKAAKKQVLKGDLHLFPEDAELAAELREKLSRVARAKAVLEKVEGELREVLGKGKEFRDYMFRSRPRDQTVELVKEAIA